MRSVFHTVMDHILYFYILYIHTYLFELWSINLSIYLSIYEVFVRFEGNK